MAGDAKRRLVQALVVANRALVSEPYPKIIIPPTNSTHAIPRRYRIDSYINSPLSVLARTRSKRGPRGQRARAHPEPRAQRRRHVAQHITAAGTAAVADDRAGSVRTQPVAAQIALCIDALNGEPGQVLHSLSLPAASCGCETPNKTPFQPMHNVGANCGSANLWCQEKTPQDVGVLLPHVENSATSDIPPQFSCTAAVFPYTDANLM